MSKTELLQEIRDAMVYVLAKMDEKGRHNPEGSSMMLWDDDWDRCRRQLVGVCDKIDEHRA